MEDPSRLSEREVAELRRHYSDAEVVEIALEAAMYCGLHRFIGAMRTPFHGEPPSG